MMNLNSLYNKRHCVYWKKCRLRLLVGVAALLFVSTSYAASEGETLYLSRCAMCHDNAQNHTPPKEGLMALSPEQITTTLTSGNMRAQGVRLSEKEKKDVAIYLTGKSFGGEANSTWQINRCKNPAPFQFRQDAQWNGWGRDLVSSRFQPTPGFAAQDIAKLKVQWSFAYPGGRRVAQPIIVGNRIFTGMFPGNVYALDAASGCTVWDLDVGSGVRNAITIAEVSNHPTAKYIALFGTNNNEAFGVNAETGDVLWRMRLDDSPVGRVTGSGAYYDGVFYLPMSSNEEVAASSKDYSCCTFRGSVTAIDIITGEKKWKTYVIDEEPKPLKINSDGQQMYGPAGAAIWSAPSIDIKRQQLYVATGDSYTDVKEDGSDAIVAIDLASGKILWKNQVTPDDNFVLGCTRGPSHGNCPEELGPDFDFGSTPVLFTLPNKQQVILAGQKSGTFYVMDPDTGKTLHQHQLGHGGALGGIQWGFAVDNNAAYVAVADFGIPEPEGKPGITAIDLATQKIRWHFTASADCAKDPGFRCANSFSQAVSAIPDAVFAGSLDGHLRAFDAKTGKVLWDYNAVTKVYDTVNGVTVKGSYFDGGGAVIANGLLVVNSGFSIRRGEMGNVLLVFGINESKKAIE